MRRVGAAVLLAAVVNAQEYDYLVLGGVENWAQAEADCSDVNGFDGHLASITSDEELNHMMGLVAADGGGNFWVGGLRSAGDRNAVNWQWTDNTPFNAAPSGNSLWNRNEPNDHLRDENCLVVAFDAGKLNDAECIRNFKAVCKRRHIANPYLADAWKPRVQNHHCYYKLFDKVVGKRLTPFVRKTWNDAQTHCHAVAPRAAFGFPGSLVKIEAQSKNQFIKDLLLGQYRIFENRPIWIGLQKNMTNGEWKWRDGETVSYHNWMLNEPNNKYANERCGQMNHAKRVSEAGGWNDAQCSMRRGYLCEVCDPNWIAGALATGADDNQLGAGGAGSSGANVGLIVLVVVVVAITAVAAIVKMKHSQSADLAAPPPAAAVPGPAPQVVVENDAVTPAMAVAGAASSAALEWDAQY